MYAVIALFDEVTENVMRQVWKELYDKSISTYAYEVEDRRPHITLASYENLEKTEFIQFMDEYYRDTDCIEVTFSSIGSFLTSGALYYAPTVTNELMKLHHRHHTYFHKFNDHPDSLYFPEQWIPHCTIANRLTPEKLAEAFSYCAQRNGSIRGTIKEIALIELHGQSMAPIVHSIMLK